MKFAAAPPNNHGLLTKYFGIPGNFVYKVSHQVGLKEAVLIEPLAVAVHANRQFGVNQAQTVIIFGSGIIGLLCAAVAKASSAGRVIVVDIMAPKLEFAKNYFNSGNVSTFLSTITNSPDDTAARSRFEFNIPHGCDVVIEASGAESSVLRME
ncbi:hypothetical protein D6D01_04493 [Aureobasidium pullulans]|uniref:Alcohol dehydrogenase-like C-terminal domain-containing protein n=1 Tax=Aureobasidium pullulans TaxID=5580 RepID=A0A4S9LAM2_AURPU|nr:hypothetical protein D6D01_04493 [Aureobasidium pullulans]